MKSDPYHRTAVPSPKRREKYHETFKSIPKNEALEYSGSCLLCESSKYYQGRMYVSTEHLCFLSKSFFGKTSVIVHLKNVIAVELATRMVFQQCLNIITYDKTYSFRAVSFKEDAYPVVLRLWQRVMGLPANVQSVFQTDLPRPTEIPEESTMLEEERVYDLPLRELVRRVANSEHVAAFYRTLTDEPVLVQTYLNRRTIQFANEFIDEAYRVDGNVLAVEYQSKGTLCRIYLCPLGRRQTRVRIIEKYNYTTQHYFAYLSCLAGLQPRRASGYAFLAVYLALLAVKLVRAAWACAQ